MKVALLSDYAPGEQLGGGIELASQFAKKLSENGSDLYIVVTGVESGQKAIRKSSRILSVFREIFDLRAAHRVINQIKSHSPDVVWVHQIGHRIPWITLVWIKLIKLPIIITLHDLNILSPKKSGTEVIQFPIKEVIKRVRLSKSIFKHLFLHLRFRLVRFIVNLSATSIISIGSIQTEILRALKVRVTRQITNGVEICEHLDLLDRDSMKILFAGRLSRKGLNLVIQSILNSDKAFHLLLAGDVDLLEYTKKRLNERDFTYLGRLSRPEIALILHQVKYVACMSQYYDNYPTIAIEALTHGAIPITTHLTGVAQLASSISPHLVVEVDQIVNLDKIDSLSLNVSCIQPMALDISTTISDYKYEISLLLSNNPKL